MTYKLFIDDEREPPTDDWQIARTGLDVLLFVTYKGCPNEISFDHDLGENTADGYTIAKTLIAMDLDADFNFFPGDGMIIGVHSQNPVGAENISKLFERYWVWRRNMKKEKAKLMEEVFGQTPIPDSEGS